MKITKKHAFSFFILSIFCLVQFFFLLPLSTPAQADTSLLDQQTGLSDIGQVYGVARGDAPLDVRIIIARIVTIALGFVASVFLIILIIAGYRYMMSSGNEERVKTATGQIKTAIVGFIITAGAWAISRFVLMRVRAAVENRVDLFYPL